MRTAKRRRLWLPALVTLAAAWISWSVPARATVYCGPHVGPMGSRLPANTPLRLVNVSGPPEIRLIREDAELGDVDVPVTLTPERPEDVDERVRHFRIVPTSLIAGAIHRFEYPSSCGLAVDRFTVSPEVPFPNALGSVAASPIRKSEADGVLVIDLLLTPDPGAAPWADLYRATSFIDGVAFRWYERVSEVAQRPLSVAVCHPDAVIGEGRHTVQLVGAPREFDAPEIATNTAVVDVRCPNDEAAPANDAGGCTFAPPLPTELKAVVGAFGLLGLVSLRRRRRMR